MPCAHPRRSPSSRSPIDLLLLRCSFVSFVAETWCKPDTPPYVSGTAGYLHYISQDVPVAALGKRSRGIARCEHELRGAAGFDAGDGAARARAGELRHRGGRAGGRHGRGRPEGGAHRAADLRPRAAAAARGAGRVRLCVPRATARRQRGHRRGRTRPGAAPARRAAAGGGARGADRGARRERLGDRGLRGVCGGDAPGGRGHSGGRLLWTGRHRDPVAPSAWAQPRDEPRGDEHKAGSPSRTRLRRPREREKRRPSYSRCRRCPGRAKEPGLDIGAPRWRPRPCSGPARWGSP